MSDDAPDPLAETPFKACDWEGRFVRCPRNGRVVLRRSNPYGKRVVCTTHARRLMRVGWSYAGVLGGLLNWDPWC